MDGVDPVRELADQLEAHGAMLTTALPHLA